MLSRWSCRCDVYNSAHRKRIVKEREREEKKKEKEKREDFFFFY